MKFVNTRNIDLIYSRLIKDSELVFTKGESCLMKIRFFIVNVADNKNNYGMANLSYSKV